MRGVTAQEMQALIDFMYTGRTNIPQKEVPTLLSTAEALQIKGLGVFNASENHDTASQAERDYGNASKRKRCDTENQTQRDYGNANKRKGCDPPALNGLYEDTSRSSTSKNLSREDQFLENLYSHHYALLSSPKQGKSDDRTPVNIPDYISGPQTPSGLERSPLKESSKSGSDANQNVPTSLSSGILNNLLHHRKADASKSSLVRSSSPAPQSPQDRADSEVVSSHASDKVKETLTEKNSCQSSSNQPSQLNPRPETKAASPRALNYSLAGLGGSKDSPSAELHGHAADESSSAHGDTPENLVCIYLYCKPSI